VVTAPVNVTGVAAAPLHIAWLAGVVTVGVGFTVMPKLRGVPLQLLATGVTIIVPVIGVIPVLVAVNDAILPDPDAARPIAILLFVQL
jgi:hypothetical protein